MTTKHFCDPTEKDGCEHLAELRRELAAVKSAIQSLMMYEGVIYNSGGVGAIIKANKALSGKGLKV